MAGFQEDIRWTGMHVLWTHRMAKSGSKASAGSGANAAVSWLPGSDLPPLSVSRPRCTRLRVLLRQLGERVWHVNIRRDGSVPSEARRGDKAPKFYPLDSHDLRFVTVAGGSLRCTDPAHQLTRVDAQALG